MIYAPVAPPTTYYGGKATQQENSVGTKIVEMANTIPHENYVEPCGGMAGVLFAKRPSTHEIYNDLSKGLVTLFRIIRDPDLHKKLLTQLWRTLYAREEWEACKDSYLSGDWAKLTDEIEQARQVYVLLDQGMTGLLGSNSGWNIGGPKHKARPVVRYFEGLENIPAVSKRLQNVRIECQDAIRIIKRWDSPNTLFYVDPPYLMSVRDSKSKGHKKRYEHEMTDPQHEDLLNLLITLKGKVLVSGYQNDLYQSVLVDGAKWYCETFASTAHSSVSTQANKLKETRDPDQAKRIECVWRSPNALPQPTLWGGAISSNKTLID